MQWVRRYWPPSENTLLLSLAVGVGVATGGGVWLFREGIDFFQQTYREGILAGLAPKFGPWAIIPVLAMAGLLVGFLMDRLIGEERHHGVAGIIESVAFAGGRLRYRRMPIKALLSSFSLGAGASVGPEDPSVQIGANLGSMFGQWLHLSDERVKLLVAAGAAGGIASAFRAPIAGVFFALETILGDFSTGSFGVVVLAAVIASVFTQAIQVGGPELGIRDYVLGGPQEIPFYILLGLLIAPISALFIRMLYWQHDLWHHLPMSRPIKTMMAGVVVGTIAMLLPRVMGTGSETMNALLNQNSGQFTISLLLLLVIGKILATTISLGGGFVGGMFAPSLFAGAAFGAAFGKILDILIPGTFSANPAAYAMAGMAAMMTGVIRAPITAVLLPFELTNDYKLILPIMLTTAVCLLVAERLAPDGIYQFALARKGVRLSRGRDIDLMQAISVGEAMSTDVQTVAATLPAEQLAAEFAKTNTHGLPVIDEHDQLCGIVTLQDLARAREQSLNGRTIGEIATRPVVTITPDESIATALRLIGERDLGRLPVVDSENPRKLVGMLRRRDIIRAYDITMHHKQEGRFRADQIRLQSYYGAHIVELRVQPGSPADHHFIRELAWPRGSVIASIWRHGQLVTPHGDTALQAGDMLTVVTTAEQESELSNLVSVVHENL